MHVLLFEFSDPAVRTTKPRALRCCRALQHHNPRCICSKFWLGTPLHTVIVFGRALCICANASELTRCPMPPRFFTGVKHRITYPSLCNRCATIEARTESGATASALCIPIYIKLFSAHVHGLAAENRVLAAAPRSTLRHRKANPAVALRPDIRVNSVIYAFYLLYSYQ